MKKLALFKEIPSTRSQMDRVAEKVKAEILSGKYDPLDLEIQLKAIEETISRIRKDQEIKQYVMDEADKRPEKSFKVGSIEITKGQRKSYDFTNDVDWRALQTAVTQATDHRKTREKLLKSGFTDPETGETAPPLEPSNTTSYLIIKFDK